MMMDYISTRSAAAPKDFAAVLLDGMAPDGGLYLPRRWPSFSASEITALRGKSYAATAFAVMRPFIGGMIADDALRAMIADTYEGGAFDDPDVAPLRPVRDTIHLLELFHGPTLSFKDYALQLVGRLFDHVLEQKNTRMTIVGATSGDTGSAAIEACKNCRNVDIFILHPKGRTSELQRRQMTSVDAPNVHNIALEGTFDDCQDIVKALFADEAFRADVGLSAVNSINWARIMAQIVYYFTAAVTMGAPERDVSFVVPTGNFGNVFAGWCARRMGLPIRTLGIATNRNDILTRFFESGEMRIEQVTPSLSPSMDIQISSNFERYLFELLGRDHDRLAALMTRFRQDRFFTVEDVLMQRAHEIFQARRCKDPETAATIAQIYTETGMVIDPHTAVAMHAALDLHAADPQTPLAVLACAHPAKFPDAVSRATGTSPPTHPRLEAVKSLPEHVTTMPADTAQIAAFVRARRNG